MTKRGKVRLVLAGAVVLALVAGTGGFFLLRDDGPSYPDEWDARIQPYVDIVEDQRDLEFEHPVAVRFLDDDEFEKTVRTDREDLDEDERADVEETASLFRAFGLISGDVDLFEAVNQASGSGTLAYYSFDDRAITVRGKKLALASQATLVHELTHALQDQHFDIGDRFEELGAKAEDGEPTTEPDALRAVVEGDAERVANLYRLSLDEDEQQALAKAEAADTDDSLADLEGVPEVILAMFGAPYALGQAIAEAVTAEDPDDIDDLFEDSPPDDSVLLDPLKAIDEIDDPTEVEIPSPADGEKKFDSGQMGSLVTYLMLAERIPLKRALAAADTWTGDAYLGFRRQDVLCARVDYATGSTKDAGLLTSAFEEWIAAPPGSTATIARDGDRVTFESCDPGEDAKPTAGESNRALELAATRGYLGVGAIRSGASPETARCFSGRLIDEYTVANLTDPDFGADDPTVAERVQGFVAECS